MGGLVRGDVVVIPFPFSDLSSAKRRPALVLATFPPGDAILCQITSQDKRDEFATSIGSEDFEEGGLPRSSYARPNKLFTAHEGIILYRAGRLRSGSIDRVAEVTAELIRGSR